MTAARFRFFDLEGKTLLITGVTRGIGRAILPELLAQGLRLILVSRGEEKMATLREELCASTGVSPERIALFHCELGDAASVAQTAEAILASGLPVDAILHNAAIDPRHWFEGENEAFWLHLFQVNLFASITLTRKLLPRLRASTQGRIVFTGSVTDALGSACLSAYVASKGAINGVTRALAHELKGSGITVNCIVPGAIFVPEDQPSEEITQLLINGQSVGRRLVPDDLTGPLCLLLSSAGGGISAQTITVDGGTFHTLADPDFQGRSLVKP